MKRCASILVTICFTSVLPSISHAEAATTASSRAATPSVHSVWSQRAFAVSDGEDYVSYVHILAHDATITWSEYSVDSSDGPGPWTHYFRSRTWVRTCATCAPTLYEFQLADVEWSDARSIAGDWVVLKNGVVKSRRCRGTVVGLEQGIGERFELTCADVDSVRPSSTWGLLGYITNRYDW